MEVRTIDRSSIATEFTLISISFPFQLIAQCSKTRFLRAKLIASKVLILELWYLPKKFQAKNTPSFGIDDSVINRLKIET